MQFSHFFYFKVLCFVKANSFDPHPSNNRYFESKIVFIRDTTY